MGVDCGLVVGRKLYVLDRAYVFENVVDFDAPYNGEELLELIQYQQFYLDQVTQRIKENPGEIYILAKEDSELYLKADEVHLESAGEPVRLLPG